MTAAVAFIMVIELCERTGFYTISSSLKSWLQNQGWSNSSSSTMQQIFSLLSYVCCFLGGWLAETPFGRYRTIVTLVACYVVGCFLAAVATHVDVESQALYFVGCFVLVALGAGGIKPNVSTFGADQIDPSRPDVERKKESFFMYFYLMINVGCIIAFGFLANVSTSGLPPLIPKEDGFFAAYLTAGSLMALALLTYLGGTPFYRKESFATNSRSVLGSCYRRLLEGSAHPLGKVALCGWWLLPCLILVSVVQAVFPSNELTYLSLALDVACIGCLCVAHRSNAWLGKPDAVTRCLDTVPALLIGNVTFNVLYNAMATTFYSQACQMDTRLGRSADAMQLNGAFFNLADAVAIVAFTPVIDKLLVPGLVRLLGRSVTYNMKVYAGIVAGMAAHLVAAVLELARRNAEVLDIGSNCAPLQSDGQHIRMSAMSAFWMSVPYGLIGIGEVLVNPVLQSVAYQGADPSMRSLMQAFNLFAMGGLPNAVSAALSQATDRLVPNDLNDGNLSLVYVINIAVGAVGCLVYFAFCGGERSSTPVSQVTDGKKAASQVEGCAEQQNPGNADGADHSSSPADRTAPVLLGHFRPPQVQVQAQAGKADAAGAQAEA